MINRLVAMMFVPLPERLQHYDLDELDVHHVDGDKTNNRPENLVWLTKEEHRDLHANSEKTKAKQSAAHKGKKHSEATKAKQSAALKGRLVSEETKVKISAALNKSVEAYDDNGNIVLTFPSTKEAGRNGFEQSSVSSCCLGKRNYHRGLHWRYIQ